MTGEKITGVSLIESDQTEEGIRYLYSVRAGGASSDARERRARRKAEQDARRRTVSLPNQIDGVEVSVGMSSTKDPVVSVFRVGVLVKESF